MLRVQALSQPAPPGRESRTMTTQEKEQDISGAVTRKGSLLQTVGAVFWSFFGVRKSSAHDADIARLNPIHVILVGVLMGILFVVSILTLVNLITSKAT